MTALANQIYGTIRVLGALLLGVMMALTCADVFMRYVLLKPILGSNEMTEALLGGVIFSGLALVTARRRHIVVTLFEPALLRWMPRTYRWLGIVCNLVGIFAVAGLLIIYGQFQFRMNNVTEILEWPYGYTAAMMAVLALVGAMLGVYALWRPVGDRYDVPPSAD